MQQLLTETLGGRSAKPYQFMCGKTPFNGDLFRAEHLIIDDEAEDITMEKRRHFAASIKAICVNPEQHCHGKHKEALTLAFTSTRPRPLNPTGSRGRCA